MIFLEFNRCVTIVNSILVRVTNHWEFLLVLRSTHVRTFVVAQHLLNDIYRACRETLRVRTQCKERQTRAEMKYRNSYILAALSHWP